MATTRRKGSLRTGKGTTRRDFLKGAGVAGLATVGSSGMLKAINAGAQAKGKPIPLGSAVPLTGWSAPDAIEFKRGVTLACEEINAMGGILGRPLEPIFEDTKNQGAEIITQTMSRLVDRHNVHAIINGYNTGATCAEYDVIADAGIIYIHHNTDITHHDKIPSDPERYFGIFMGDPAEYYYGAGILHFLQNLLDKGLFKRPNNKIAIITSSQNYSVVIANALRDNAAKWGWEISFFDTVVVPITEWGPTLSKLRRDPPAVIVNTHWAPQDLAQFMIQFVPNPTNSLVYLQYGPLLQAFREIGQEATNYVVYSTLLGALQDEIGLAFDKRYKKRHGQDSSPVVGAQPYDSCHYYAICAAVAGGTGEPGNFEQNRKIAERLRHFIYRGVMGTTAFMLPEQACRPYPDMTPDPSLGIPHIFLQIQDWQKPSPLIAPPPYETGTFKMPPWMKV